MLDKKLKSSHKKNFFMVKNSFIRNENLNVYEKVVFMDLLSHCYFEGTVAFPSIRTIASHLGISPNTVNKAIEGLEKKNGILKIHRIRSNGKKTANGYLLADVDDETGEFLPFDEDDIKEVRKDNLVAVTDINTGEIVELKENKFSFTNVNKGKKLSKKKSNKKSKKNDKKSDKIVDLDEKKESNIVDEKQRGTSEDMPNIKNIRFNNDDFEQSSTDINIPVDDEIVNIENIDEIDDEVKRNQIMAENQVKIEEIKVNSNKSESNEKEQLMRKIEFVERMLNNHITMRNYFIDQGVSETNERMKNVNTKIDELESQLNNLLEQL